MMSLFKNPMMLMMAFSVIVMVVMPKMMGQLGAFVFSPTSPCAAFCVFTRRYTADPEALKEYEAAQQQAGNPMDMLKSMFNGEEPEADEGAQSTPAVVRRPNRKKTQRR